MATDQYASYRVSDAAPTGLTDLGVLPFRTDAGIGARAAIGLLVLETDQTVEHEARAIWPADGVALYAARLHNDPEITVETLRDMAGRIAPAAALLPNMVGLSVVGFACTSGAMVIGEAEVAKLVRAAHPAVQVTDPVTAMCAAVRALGLTRVALLTPYVREINLRMAAALGARGVNVAVMGSFEEADDTIVARIDEASILDAIIRLGESPECDGVLVSCTSLRVARIVERAEAAIGKPVTSSNHALAWHMLRLGGIDDPIPGFGRLYHSGA